MKKNDSPRAWQLYERGKAYNQALWPSQYDLVRTNTEFFIGNQWLHLPDTPAMRTLPKPTFNILKRVASLFIASLTSAGVTVRYEPLAYYDGGGRADPHHDAAAFVNAEVANLMEKLKLDYRVRQALFDGAQTGDYCAHFWFDPQARPYGGALGAHRGEIRMELVDGINVMFGDPAQRRVQEQPYVLLVGRATVDELEREARLHGREGERILPDGENDLFPGMGPRAEQSAGDGADKALYVLLYTKVTRRARWVDELGREREEDVTTVHATKATRTGVIFQDVDTGLSLYPVAWGNWETQKNQYHGRALVTGLIPNQIFINTMFATAMRHMQLMAFPKTIYNADLVDRWTNEVGQAIAVHGLQPGQSVGQAAAHIQPAEMSGQILTLIDRAMAYTKECLGATDAQMGNVKPDNTSALMVLQTNSEVPLENIRAGLYEWLEDIGEILPDLMATYYGLRPVVMDREFEEPVTDGAGTPMVDPGTGRLRTRRVVRRVTVPFDFSALKHVTLGLRIDVGAATYFSEIAMTQTLDNLRRDGTLDVIEYLERIPDKLIPRKQELLDRVRRRVEQGEQDNAPAGAALPVGEEANFFAELPVNTQTRWGELSAWAKRGARMRVRR